MPITCNFDKHNSKIRKTLLLIGGKVQNFLLDPMKKAMKMFFNSISLPKKIQFDTAVKIQKPKAHRGSLSIFATKFTEQ
jgi:hypothetical protein